MIHLRDIDYSDEDFFARWWRDPVLAAMTDGDSRPITHDEMRYYFSQLMDGPDALHFMIEADGKTIGNLSLLERTQGWWELQMVIGEKDQWGHGFGTEALKAGIAMAKERAISRLFVMVRTDNQRALHVCRKVGFHEAKKQPEAPHLVRLEQHLA